jgi:electron transport complex protein RnfD
MFALQEDILPNLIDWQKHFIKRGVLPKMADKLIVKSSPHRHKGVFTSNIMLDVLIALIPAVVAATVIFGFGALVSIVFSAAFSLLCEYVFNLVIKKKQTVGDLSALVTGVILALNMPAALPLYMLLIGDFFAIIIVKALFGGMGKNFANPAMTARIVLTIAFPSAMSTFIEPFSDAVASATPLASKSASYMDLFLGNTAGSIGEVSALALIIGGIYLIAKKVISPVIPVSFVGTVALISLILNEDPLYAVLSGGLLLGAIFMATDYVTSPITTRGKWIFGIGLGVLTAIIRIFGSYPEGVSFAILLMNICTPLIEKIPSKKPFGAGGAK